MRVNGRDPHRNLGEPEDASLPSAGSLILVQIGLVGAAHRTAMLSAERERGQRCSARVAAFVRQDPQPQVSHSRG